MLAVSPGGRERTETDYADLVQTTGFKLTKIVPTEFDIGVIEAVKEPTTFLS